MRVFLYMILILARLLAPISNMGILNHNHASATCRVSCMSEGMNSRKIPALQCQNFILELAPTRIRGSSWLLCRIENVIGKLWREVHRCKRTELALFFAFRDDLFTCFGSDVSKASTIAKRNLNRRKACVQTVWRTMRLEMRQQGCDNEPSVRFGLRSMHRARVT